MSIWDAKKRKRRLGKQPLRCKRPTVMVIERYLRSERLHTAMNRWATKRGGLELAMCHAGLLAAHYELDEKLRGASQSKGGADKGHRYPSHPLSTLHGVLVDVMYCLASLGPFAAVHTFQSGFESLLDDHKRRNGEEGFLTRPGPVDAGMCDPDGTTPELEVAYYENALRLLKCEEDLDRHFVLGHPATVFPKLQTCHGGSLVTYLVASVFTDMMQDLTAVLLHHDKALRHRLWTAWLEAVREGMHTKTCWRAAVSWAEAVQKEMSLSQLYEDDVCDVDRWVNQELVNPQVSTAVKHMYTRYQEWNQAGQPPAILRYGRSPKADDKGSSTRGTGVVDEVIQAHPTIHGGFTAIQAHKDQDQEDHIRDKGAEVRGEGSHGGKETEIGAYDGVRRRVSLTPQSGLGSQTSRAVALALEVVPSHPSEFWKGELLRVRLRSLPTNEEEDQVLTAPHGFEAPDPVVGNPQEDDPLDAGSCYATPWRCLLVFHSDSGADAMHYLLSHIPVIRTMGLGQLGLEEVREVTAHGGTAMRGRPSLHPSDHLPPEGENTSSGPHGLTLCRVLQDFWAGTVQVLVTTHQALAVLMRHELSTPIAHTGSSQLLPTCHLVLHYDLLAAPLVDLRAHGQLMSLVGAEEVLLMREKDNIGQDIHLEVYLRMIGVKEGEDSIRKLGPVVINYLEEVKGWAEFTENFDRGAEAIVQFAYEHSTSRDKVYEAPPLPRCVVYEPPPAVMCVDDEEEDQDKELDGDMEGDAGAINENLPQGDESSEHVEEAGDVRALYLYAFRLVVEDSADSEQVQRQGPEGMAVSGRGQKGWTDYSHANSGTEEGNERERGMAQEVGGYEQPCGQQGKDGEMDVELCQTLGILTLRELPSLPPFYVWLRSGRRALVFVQGCGARRVTMNQLAMAQVFHCVLTRFLTCGIKGLPTALRDVGVKEPEGANYMPSGFLLGDLLDPLGLDVQSMRVSKGSPCAVLRKKAPGSASNEPTAEPGRGSDHLLQPRYVPDPIWAASAHMAWYVMVPVMSSSGPSEVDKVVNIKAISGIRKGSTAASPAVAPSNPAGGQTSTVEGVHCDASGVSQYTPLGDVHPQFVVQASELAVDWSMVTSLATGEVTNLQPVVSACAPQEPLNTTDVESTKTGALGKGEEERCMPEEGSPVRSQPTREVKSTLTGEDVARPEGDSGPPMGKPRTQGEAKGALEGGQSSIEAASEDPTRGTCPGGGTGQLSPAGSTQELSAVPGGVPAGGALQSGDSPLEANSHGDRWGPLRRLVEGGVLITLYRRRDTDNHRLYRGVRLREDLNLMSAFPDGRGDEQGLEDKYITFEDYYRDNWSQSSLTRCQPLVESLSGIGKGHDFNRMVPPDHPLSRRSSSLAKKLPKKGRDHLSGPLFLVPELCALHPLPLRIWQAAMGLPAYIYRTMSLLRAQELREKITPPELPPELHPSVWDVLEATTTRNCREGFDMERYELLGDSYLKYAMARYLFLARSDWHQGPMGLVKIQWASNAYIAALAIKKQYIVYIRAGSMQANTWRAPGQEYVSRLQEYQVVGKVMADTMEALIGMFHYRLGPRVAFLFVNHIEFVPRVPTDSQEWLTRALPLVQWLGPPKHAFKGPGAVPGPTPSPSSPAEAMATKGLPESSAADGLGLLLGAPPSLNPPSEVEVILGYRFHRPVLVLQALTHDSFNEESVTMAWGAVEAASPFTWRRYGCTGKEPLPYPSYQRLEFFGDAILDILQVQYFFHHHPGIVPHKLSKLKEVAVNNSRLAEICVRHGLHKYVRANDTVQRNINKFASQVQEQGHELGAVASYGTTHTKAPKVLADVLEALIAAVYLDCNEDMEVTWKVVEPLLQPMPDDSDHVEDHPVAVLFEELASHGWVLKWEVTGSQEEGWKVEARALGVTLGRAANKESKTVAKKFAAKDANDKWEDLLPVLRQRADEISEEGRAEPLDFMYLEDPYEEERKERKLRRKRHQLSEELQEEEEEEYLQQYGERWEQHK